MYKFIKEQDLDNKFDYTRVELHADAECIPDLLEAFKRFLLASGFSVEGELVLEEDTDT